MRCAQREITAPADTASPLSVLSNSALVSEHSSADQAVHKHNGELMLPSDNARAAHFCYSLSRVSEHLTVFFLCAAPHQCWRLNRAMSSGVHAALQHLRCPLEGTWLLCQPVAASWTPAALRPHCPFLLPNGSEGLKLMVEGQKCAHVKTSMLTHSALLVTVQHLATG